MRVVLNTQPVSSHICSVIAFSRVPLLRVHNTKLITSTHWYRAHLAFYSRAFKFPFKITGKEGSSHNFSTQHLKKLEMSQLLFEMYKRTVEKLTVDWCYLGYPSMALRLVYY